MYFYYTINCENWNFPKRGALPFKNFSVEFFALETLLQHLTKKNSIMQKKTPVIQYEMPREAHVYAMVLRQQLNPMNLLFHTVIIYFMCFK